MNQFNLGNFINKFINYSLLNSNQGTSNKPNQNVNTDAKFQLTNEALPQNLLTKPVPNSAVLSTFNMSTLADLKMNNLANLDRSLYLKGLMNLPKEMEEILLLIQNNTAKTADITKLLSTNINLSMLAELIKEGGKDALNKLILVMANASKQGMTDLSQIKDAIKLINASVSVASGDNPEKILKSFMLLYLPWIPLQEGVDFNLEIENSQSETQEAELSITILISTRNYGNVKIILFLAAGNSMNIIISCDKSFPKDELLKRIKAESQNYSIQPEVVFEQKTVKKDENTTPQAKISMSSITEVNPFLLLMANAVIRHTIELDNLAN